MIDLRLLVAAVTAAVALSGTSFAASRRTIDVITHAAFFSEEMKQSEVVDPPRLRAGHRSARNCRPAWYQARGWIASGLDRT